MYSDDRTIISNRGLWWTLLAFVCLVVGVLCVFVEPLFIIAVVIVLANVVLVAKYPFYGLLVYLFIFLIRPAEIYPALSVLRMELLLGGLVLLSIIFNQKIRTARVVLPRDKITVALAAFLVAISLSIFTSYEATITKETIVEFIKILIFYYLIVSLVDTRKRFITFVATFVLLISYIAFDALVGYLAGQFVHTMDVDRLTGSTSAGGDANTLATTLVTTTPLLVATALHFRHCLVKSFLALVTLSMTYLVIITASRGGLLAFFAVVFGGIGFARRKLMLVIAVFLLSIAAWAVMPEQYRERYAAFTDVTSNINSVSSGRWEIWGAGLRMMVGRPILGVGAGAFPWAYGSGDFGPPQMMSPHNVYIQVLATTGLVGFMAWVIFLYILVKSLNETARQAQRLPHNRWYVLFRNSFFVILIALFVSGMFGHSLFRYTWYVVAALAAAMGNIMTSHKAELENEADQSTDSEQDLAVTEA
jgi:O-antigen ligase